jgi:hypothetical protein
MFQKGRSLKEQCHEIFRLRFFLSKNSPGLNRHAQNDFNFFRIFMKLFVFVIDSPVMNTPGSGLEYFRLGNFCEHKSRVPT